MRSQKSRKLLSLLFYLVTVGSGLVTSPRRRKKKGAWICYYFLFTDFLVTYNITSIPRYNGSILPTLLLSTYDVKSTTQIQRVDTTPATVVPTLPVKASYSSLLPFCKQEASFLPTVMVTSWDKQIKMLHHACHSSCRGGPYSITNTENYFEKSSFTVYIMLFSLYLCM